MPREPLRVRFEVPASAEAVHRFMIRDYFTNHTRWDGGLDELVALDDGPVRSGTRGREVRRFLGRQETEFEIVEVTDRRLRLVDEPSMWRLERTYELEPTGTGTAVTFTFDMRPSSLLFRVVYPLARPVIARQVRRNMAVLAGLLEDVGSSEAGSAPTERSQPAGAPRR